MSFAFLHRYPFLRLLFPLAMGIYVGDELFFRGFEIPLNGVLWTCFLPLLALLIAAFYLKRYAFRWLFGVLLILFFFISGGTWMNVQLQRTAVPSPDAEAVYHAAIMEKPELKERSVLCRVELTTPANDSVVLSRPVAALLYLAKDSLSGLLCSGEELLISARISRPQNSGNPDEFDYSRYLARKEVSGTGFVAADSWKKLSHKSTLTLKQQALIWRERVLAIYRNLGFRGDEFAVLSALTVGYKEELSEEIKETYSVSGASHVLALSGLHIGFLYGLLLFCLKGMPDRWKGVRLLRALTIIVLLWGFAFFTGLSPSVVRSVLMCSLFALSGAFGRESFSINTLSAAAFFMLLCCPEWLFDVGFQLSFCAVGAILLLQPGIYRVVPKSNRFGNYVWGLMSVSIAAQIGTAPLVLLYFSRFSTHFLLTNLVVIPLVSVCMYGAVLLLLLTPFPWFQSGVVWGVKGLIGLLNEFVRWVEHLPWASLDAVWVYPLEVFLFYLALLCWMYYQTIRSGKSLLTCLCCVLFLCTFHVAMLLNDRPQESLTFYNVRGCPVAHCMAADGRSWLAYGDSLPDETKLHRAVSRHWQHLHLETPQPVTVDCDEPAFSSYNRILSFSGRRVCIVSDNRWRNKLASQPLFIDYLYLCRGYDGRLEWLTELFTFQTVILDASLSDYRREAFKRECRQLGFHFISLSEKGSVRFLL